MKVMKLGSKPDAFQADGSCVRYISSELPTDVVINVDDMKFHLHKFPLLSKSSKLQKLVSKANEENSAEIQLPNFPGGPTAFEICAKFCYGITVTLNPYNLVSARCAAEYLEMTEDIEKGNLIKKIEIFLNSSILRSWKDSIIVLQTAKALMPLSENLKVVNRCVESIACKISVDPSLITWSYTYNRKLATSDQIISEKTEFAPKDWWIEDICELDIDLYKKVMVGIKSKGRVPSGLIGEALKTYAVRWLPDSVDLLLSEDQIQINKSLVETIICLLPSDKGIISCSCSFLLKLLKVAILIGADDSYRDDLIKIVGMKLDEACVSDLLIPGNSQNNTIYDVDLVQRLVDEFVKNENGKRDLKNVEEKNECDFVLGNGSWLRAGKVVDGYLSVVASDPNLTVASFVKLAESVPESARPIHDGHANLPKAERKTLCGLMDVKKLTSEGCMHAAQNEQLPLRVVVQVLFFEQAKASANNTSSPKQSRENWAKTGPTDMRKSLRMQLDDMKIKEDEQLVENGKHAKRGGKSRGSEPQLLPSRSRRIFEKLWIVGKGFGNGENKSSETFASSQSPASMVQQGQVKSSGSCSRHRRHSIS
ncbi:phototropic-responsive NPH3 family protein [Striga asiatica]|uniref:Phototropic-responsive NPH3 family protein n=1 Tax=Striga asiatica TaxID=4170 RepID=A0A5A7PD44_STRAF|nr:phototropic-responsive NPH3 family protein [Striga asiatica]